MNLYPQGSWRTPPHDTVRCSNTTKPSLSPSSRSGRSRQRDVISQAHTQSAIADGEAGVVWVVLEKSHPHLWASEPWIGGPNMNVSPLVGGTGSLSQIAFVALQESNDLTL